MERLRRKDSFFGLHFDFHARPENILPPVGENLTEEIIREICETIQPDFIQIDCKGHPGYASYPSKLNNYITPMQGDPLKLWRRVTDECGVALYMHYSGVLDGLYVERNPEEAVILGDGSRHPQATSVFGKYADELLIPQMKELAGEYGVDGIWIDGECWGTDVDYSPRALEAFYQETGIDVRENPPTEDGMPYYRELRAFARESFLRYLRHYTEELHKVYPEFQIASNWSFTDHMPEPVSADVDFLSGDYSPQDSFNTARYCGRIIEAQDMPWDLMAWNFRHSFDEPQIHCPKHPEQIKQEAAAVMCLGGGFQNYITQLKDGNPRMNEIRQMKEVAKFCRERQPYCHKGRMVPQAVIFNSKHDHYLNTERIFLNTQVEALRGWTQILCETQQSVEIRSEHNFLDADPNRFPFAVVADLKKELDAESAEKLMKYAENGGNLVVSGRVALEAMIEAGAPFALEESGYESFTFVTEDQYSWVTTLRNVPKLVCDGGEVLLWGCVNDSGYRNEIYPVCAVKSVGKGKIFAVSYDMGMSYYEGSTNVIRSLLKKIEAMSYEPIVKVEGSMYCDVCVLEKDGKRFIQLVNTAGGHGDAKMLTIDEIPPIGPLKLSIACESKPEKVMLQPEGIELAGEYTNGRFETVIDRLYIHSIVTVE